MRIVSRIAGGVRALVRRDRVDAELDDELREYLAAAVDARLARGMSRDQALRQARAELGSPAAVKDRVRDVGWESRVESVCQDVRYAVRVLRRSPGFAFVAIVTFAVGIGANVAVFGIVDATLLKPLPFHAADRLVDILEVRRPGTAEETFYSGMTRARLDEWRAQRQIFDGIEAVKSPRPMALEEGGTTVRVAQVSPGVFPLLGLSPILGRNFSAAEGAAGDERVVLIGHGLWLRAFGGARDVVGRTISLANRQRTIVGVMAPEARFPVGRAVDAWIPLTRAVDPQDPSSAVVGVVARLRPGLTIASAQREVALAAEAIQRLRPSREPWTAQVESIDPRRWLRGSQPIVLLAFGAVMFVFFTACANIGSLLMARGATRDREMALRRAIGASRARLARQLLIETLVVAALGGIAALALAAWLIPAIPAWLPPGFIAFPTHDAVLDRRVFAAGVLGTALAGMLSGVWPALRGSRAAAALSLSSGAGITAAPARRRALDVLLATQVVFACVLLVGAGLMTTSFVRMLVSDPGYRLDDLLALSISLPRDRYPTRTQQAPVFAELLDRARSAPGVAAATIGTPPPTDGAGALTAEDRQRDQDARAGAALLWTGPDYFSVLGIRIVSGRTFDAGDREGTEPVAIIDEEMARRLWPGENPLGKRVRYSPYVPWMTVVGVAADVKTSRAAQAAESFELYMPIAQDPQWNAMTILMRVPGGDRSALSALRTGVQRVAPTAAVRSAGTVRDLYGPSLSDPRVAALLMSAFAAIALVTAGVGLFGVLSYSVSRRGAEIAVRMALGASTFDVRRLVIAESLAPLGVGLAVGMAAAQVLSRGIAALLYRTTPLDPLAHAAVVTVFGCVGLIAAYVPARRATRVDPLVALRAE